MQTSLFRGFDHVAAITAMAAFINEMSSNCLWSANRLALEAKISDRTLRKALAGDDKLKIETYYCIIEVLAIYHQYSTYYVMYRLMKCEKKRVMMEEDDTIIRMNDVIVL